jgi:hypothetical protein
MANPTINRVVVIPSRAEIAEMSFPTRPDLVGINAFQNGGFLTREKYDDIAQTFDSVYSTELRDLYKGAAKIFCDSGHNAAFEAATQDILNNHAEDFKKSGLTLQGDDLRVVNDHANQNGKEYNAVIIDVKSPYGTRSIRGDSSPAAIAFNLSENFTAAGSLVENMKLGDAQRAESILRSFGMGRERAAEAANNLTASPLVTSL